MSQVWSRARYIEKSDVEIVEKVFAKMVAELLQSGASGEVILVGMARIIKAFVRMGPPADQVTLETMLSEFMTGLCEEEVFH